MLRVTSSGSVARLFIRETSFSIEIDKDRQPDTCQVVTQAPPLVTTFNVNRTNLATLYIRKHYFACEQRTWNAVIKGTDLIVVGGN